MRKLTATLCLTLAVLLGSMGVSWSADYQRGLISFQSEDYANALLEWEFLKKQVNKNFQTSDTSKLYSPTSVLFLGNSLTYYNFSISDTLSELKLEFTSKELAISYAKKKKIDFDLIEPKKRKIVKKSYAYNFLK